MTDSVAGLAGLVPRHRGFDRVEISRSGNGPAGAGFSVGGSDVTQNGSFLRTGRSPEKNLGSPPSPRTSGGWTGVLIQYPNSRTLCAAERVVLMTPRFDRERVAGAQQLSESDH
jgi:hypothetical protein